MIDKNEEKEQKKEDLLIFIENKVKELFSDFPVPAHGINHVTRVANWATVIARDEEFDEFLAKVTALLHDIGRVAEFNDNPDKLRHHELSYILLKKWFHEFREFDILSEEEKEQILYAVRYHWNDEAEKYPLANILRDSDKLDMYGEIGLKRAHDFFTGLKDREKDVKKNLMLFYKIKTKTAKKIIEDNNLLEPLKKYLESL